MDEFENQGWNTRKNTNVLFKHMYFPGFDSVCNVRLIREYTVPAVP